MHWLMQSIQIIITNEINTHFGLISSWMSLSFSLKHPSEQMAFKTSGSTDEADGRTCVCTTSIIGNSSSSSPLPPAVTHGCRLISPRVSRLSGFTSIMPRSKLWQSGGTKCGIWNTPRFTFSNNCRRLSSSNGRAPTNKAYRITPHDHTSARRPSYFSPYLLNCCETKLEKPFPAKDAKIDADFCFLP